MRRLKIISLALLCLSCALLVLTQVSTVRANVPAQIPTGSVPTVTGTPTGGIATVLDNEQGFAHVRSGPSAVDFEIVGTLIIGQQVPAVGRTLVGDWIEVAYPGVPGGVAWVWKDLVDVKGNVPIVDAPPTPTPRVTATIDPTLAAQFLVEIQPTRLPTFTPPPPLVIPTFPAEPSSTGTAGVPMGLVIIGMAVIGVFGTLISFLRGR